MCATYLEYTRSIYAYICGVYTVCIYICICTSRIVIDIIGVS